MSSSHIASAPPKDPMLISFPCCQTKVRVSGIGKNSYLEFQNELHCAVARQTDYLSSPCSFHIEVAQLLKENYYLKNSSQGTKLEGLLEQKSWKRGFLLAVHDSSDSNNKIWIESESDYFNLICEEEKKERKILCYEKRARSIESLEREIDLLQKLLIESNICDRIIERDAFVLVQWKNSKDLAYFGKITKMNPDGTIEILFNDNQIALIHHSNIIAVCQKPYYISTSTSVKFGKTEEQNSDSTIKK